jgi:hypothetical protein
MTDEQIDSKQKEKKKWRESEKDIKRGKKQKTRSKRKTSRHIENRSYKGEEHFLEIVAKEAKAWKKCGEEVYL